MPDLSDVTAVAVIALAALLGGVVFARLKQPAIIGYIVAGALLGPAGAGLANNQDAVDVLAEFGVLMLLFLVGMQLDLRRFVAGWRIALFVTAIQIAGSVGVAMLLAPLLQWNMGLSILLGFIVSVSSTAVVIKILESSDELGSRVGRISIGILIAQDMAVVPMMMVLSALSRKGFDLVDLGKVGGSILFLVLLFFVLLRYKVRLPFAQTVANHPDLSPLTGLAWCFGAATLAAFLGLSPAYGAFLAGVVVGNTAERDAMLQSSQPIQSVLMMVFFVSVGLLLDLPFIWHNLGTVIALLMMVTVFKTILNIIAVKLMGESWPRSFMVGVALAQIGEFSFVLAGIGRDNRLLTSQESRLVVTVTVLSLMLSPFWLMAARRLHRLAASGMASPRDLLRAFEPRGLPVSPISLPLHSDLMPDAESESETDDKIEDKTNVETVQSAPPPSHVTAQETA